MPHLQRHGEASVTYDPVAIAVVLLSLLAMIGIVELNLADQRRRRGMTAWERQAEDDKTADELQVW
jgi:hypothetical protein